MSGPDPIFDNYDIAAEQLARELLGLRLVRVLNGERLAGTIVETEAYLGVEDKAAHSHGGRRTQRTESMFLEGGHAYVYLIYGIHHCMNVVCGGPVEGAAVLVRALRATEGLPRMQELRGTGPSETKLCSGPGNLAKALSIDRTLDGRKLHRGSDLFIEVVEPTSVIERDVVTAPRIGVHYAEEWAERPLRFFLADEPSVSERTAPG